MHLALAGALCLTLRFAPNLQAEVTDYLDPTPFGAHDPKLAAPDTLATGNWWESETSNPRWRKAQKWIQSRERKDALAFALYTVNDHTLKLTAQCLPLLPDEPKTIELQFKFAGAWHVVASEAVQYPGWSAHFRVGDIDTKVDIPYRLKLGELSCFEGLIRKNPVDTGAIAVAVMSCNSPQDEQVFTRSNLVQNLMVHDPDLLFFAGDQNYTHEEATYGWLQFGMQFASIMKDRPTICIPDDHDVGQYNLWGASGKHSKSGKSGSDGGYCYPPEFVKMVERQQTWSLPDAFDPSPVQRGITTYYTDYTLGGVSFAILEDRKFKSAPLGNIPEMGPRPDHINDPSYQRSSIDVPGLSLLGQRQLDFLDHWVRDWEGAKLKVALSQTAFCGAVNLHGSMDNRLLADLDCNGWPQSGRNRALKFLQAVQAFHLCGDQHLATVVQHGIERFRDGPFAFTSPALVNTIYGRWWWPVQELAGGGVAVNSQLPWVGDYEDGLGNRITMHAYANPEAGSQEGHVKELDKLHRGDGYGLCRIDTTTGDITFECWPRFADVNKGASAQYPGWPIQIKASDNDGRLPVAYLPPVKLPSHNAVVELTNLDTGELVYCYRAKGDVFRAPVYESSQATYQIKAGHDRPEQILLNTTFVSQ